nr:hypothetical protein [Tanacetum cinerariifolium]
GDVSFALDNIHAPSAMVTNPEHDHLVKPFLAFVVYYSICFC